MADFQDLSKKGKIMIRNACLWTVFVAASALAQKNDVHRCSGPASEHRAQDPSSVVFWSTVADNSIAVLGGKSPQQGSIKAAIVQVAVYDAVNAVCGYPFTPYAARPDVHGPALPEAAVAAAAHDALTALYPDQAVTLDQQYAAYLAGIPGHHEEKLNGAAIGKQAAAAILALRANDGRNAGVGWTPPSPGPGIWEPTPPEFLPAATAWIRFVTPWTMTSPSQFHAPPPPALESDVWMRDYNEIKAYGGAVSNVRTVDQTDLAVFVGGPGVHPMLQWHDAWRRIATGQKLSVLSASRLFVELATISSDALIGCWDSKFQYAFWRPVTAIRAGGGNPSLVADPTWIGPVTTPNYPEYPAAPTA
jgi:hypothetical protein